MNLKANSKEALEQLIEEAGALLAPAGYEVVALEQSTSPSGRTLTLFIDFLGDDDQASPKGAPRNDDQASPKGAPRNDDQASPKGAPRKNDDSRRIGLDDCVEANRLVDELFESTPLLSGHYTLEVSSPGVERPLRKAEDYTRFRGRMAMLHTFRPLEKEEAGNPAYWETHKKQKNFVGRLEGLSDRNGAPTVKMLIDGQAVSVPLALISKARLEGDFKIRSDEK